MDDVVRRIRTLAVRGAPAIGDRRGDGARRRRSRRRSKIAPTRFLARADSAGVATISRATRPTAVNLPWAIERMLRVASGDRRRRARRCSARCAREATAILDEDRAMCRRIGEHGLSLTPDGARVLTHCNAGALATGGIGTALGADLCRGGARAERRGVRRRDAAAAAGKPAHGVGAAQARHPVTVLADGMAASLMRDGRSTSCIVGADRIAANGDVANKIGTYPLAIAARHHGIRSTSRRRRSTVDPATATGDEIVIEQRRPTSCGASAFVAPASPRDVAVYNPAFDVTPAALVTAIVTDRGIMRPPYRFGRIGTASWPVRSVSEMPDHARIPTLAEALDAHCAGVWLPVSRCGHGGDVQPIVSLAARRARCSSVRRPGRSRDDRRASRSPAARARRSSAGSARAASTSRPRANGSTSRRSRAATGPAAQRPRRPRALAR